MALPRGRGGTAGAQQQLVLKKYAKTDIVVKSHLDVTTTIEQY